MDYLWTPWRYTYISGEAKVTTCIFCDLQQAADDRSVFILLRARHNYVVLNKYPFTNGHIMIVPYAHIDELRKLPAEVAADMMSLAQRLEDAIRRVYNPEGVNLGMNLGKAAGAGVAGHVHLHVLPRWCGDANFITTVAETRALPETLERTWERLREALA